MTNTHTGTLATELLAKIESALAAGQRVNVGTAYKVYSLTQRTADRCAMGGFKLLRIGKSGNLGMFNGAGYIPLTMAGGQLLLVSVAFEE